MRMKCSSCICRNLRDDERRELEALMGQLDRSFIESTGGDLRI